MPVICKSFSFPRPDSVITTSSLVSSSDGASQAGDSSTEVGLHSVYAFSGLYGNKMAQVRTYAYAVCSAQGNRDDWHLASVTRYLYLRVAYTYIRVWKRANGDASCCQMADGEMGN